MNIHFKGDFFPLPRSTIRLDPSVLPEFEYIPRSGPVIYIFTDLHSTLHIIPYTTHILLYTPTNLISGRISTTCSKRVPDGRVMLVTVRTINAHNRREPERTVSISGPADTAALRRVVARDLYSLRRRRCYRRRRRRRIVGVSVAPPPTGRPPGFQRVARGGIAGGERVNVVFE